MAAGLHTATDGAQGERDKERAAGQVPGDTSAPLTQASWGEPVQPRASARVLSQPRVARTQEVRHPGQLLPPP